MKKIILSCFLAVFTAVFTGCDYNEDAKYINEMSDEIVRCFDERNIDVV